MSRTRPRHAINGPADILDEANKVADFDGARAYRFLLSQVKLFATATRDLYRARYFHT